MVKMLIIDHDDDPIGGSQAECDPCSHVAYHNHHHYHQHYIFWSTPVNRPSAKVTRTDFKNGANENTESD